MSGREDVEFTFNPDSFIKGVKKMTDAMNNFEGNTKTKGKQIEGTHNSISAGMIAKGQILANMFMKLAGSVVGFVKSGVPEIGRTFDIAGDIFKRNLFWPLRKELAPMLQKILDWTRDHRAMFVQWGGALVNVFRAVIQIFKGFYKMFETMIKPIADKLKSIFGGVAGGISDVFNIVLFKITAVIMFLQAAFMPLFQRIGDLIAWVIGLVSEFFKGFSDGISGIAGPFGDVINMFNMLLDSLSLGTEQTEFLYKAFKVLGDFIGTVLYGAVSLIAGIIDALAVSVANFVDGILWAKAKISGTEAEVEAINARIEKRNKDSQDRQLKRWEGMKQKTGDFIDRTGATFSPTAKTSSKQINANSKVVVEKIEIKVDPSMDTKKAGSDFVEGMNKKNSQNMKKLIMDDQLAQGI